MYVKVRIHYTNLPVFEGSCSHRKENTKVLTRHADVTRARTHLFLGVVVELGRGALHRRVTDLRRAATVDVDRLGGAWRHVVLVDVRSQRLALRTTTILCRLSLIVLHVPGTAYKLAAH